MMKFAKNPSPSCADILQANGWIEWVDNQARLVDQEHFWKEISSVIETMAEAGYFLTQTCFRDWMQHRLADDVDSWFERRPYIIRHPDLADLPALLALEEISWIEPLRATEEELRHRIQSHRAGQFLLEMDGAPAGVIYSQRIAAIDPIFDHTFRTVSALHVPDGKIVQPLAVNSLPSLQQYALGDQLLEFLLQLATLNPAIEQVVGVTLCKLYRAEQELTIAEYIHQRNQYGQPSDPILNFHYTHGAQIKGLVPNYRPPDLQNEGNGVLVVYDLQNRLGSSQRSEIHPQIDIPAVLEKTVRSLLGAERVAGYAPNRALREMGLDSLELLELRGALTKQMGILLDPTFFFRHSTVAAMIAYFEQQASQRTAAPAAPSVAAARPDEPIAVIGMACRFPGGVTTPVEFWELLRNGVDAISEIPASRWDVEGLFGEEAGKIHTRYGGFIEQVDQFDAPFFHIAPVEAKLLDPQQRILLETHWEALENAGIDPTRLKGSDTGIYVGIFTDDYRLLQIKQPDPISPYFGTGTSNSVAAGRIAYFLGTQGPALSVDTACSSSLVSIHLACQSLKTGESSLALASGINLLLSPELSQAFSQANMLARDGRCKTFDAGADGYVRSEGCGVIVLKRLRDAQADGDTILAVIRGTALNQDGASNGLTAPNGLAQETVIRKALAAAQLQPTDIAYVEAHGTGTPLGDPVEINALTAVYAGDRAQPLVVGSVKTNIGHTESAAGIAGFLKVVLALQNEWIPPHLHCNQINPLLADAPIDIPGAGRPWPRGEQPRRGAVSSFGFSGTNAHVIIEEAPALPEPFDFRAEIVRLASIAWEGGERPKIAFLFTGQGSQYLNMGRELYETHPLFRERMERCDAVFSSLFGKSLIELLYPATTPGHNDLMESHPIGQAANFAIEAALADLWRSWGVAPDVVLGHSLGDFAAAYTAGVISLEDGLRLVTQRGRLMETADGSMLSVLASEAQVTPLLAGRDDVTIGVINAPDSIVVSGSQAGVAQVAEKVRAAGFKMRKLDIPVAAHSPLLDPVLDQFEVTVRAIPLAAPHCAVVSSMTGRLVSAELTDPTYWRSHLRNPVCFSQAVETLSAEKCEVLIEVGPQDTLLKLAQQTLADRSITTLPSLSPDMSNWAQLLAGVEQLARLGVPIHWKALQESCHPAWQLLTLSARSEPALREMAGRYSAWLRDNPNVDLAALGQAVRVGRAHFDYRVSLAADSAAALQSKLLAFAQGKDSSNVSPVGRANTAPKIAFLFTGQGAQYVGMGRELYDTQPTFRAALQRCDALLRPLLGRSISQVIFAGSGDRGLETGDWRLGTGPIPDPHSPLPTPLDHTAYTQPALFALEYALAQLWLSWGVRPDLLIGHSIGELTAACVAGVFSLEDAVRLVAARGQLMGDLPPDGEMLSLLASEEEAQTAIAPYNGQLSIAAINAPRSVVISGRREAVLAVAEQLTAAGIKTRRLTVSHAFHSPLMQPMLADFRRVAESITYHPARLRLISNLSGKVAGTEIATPDYWVRHVREAVRFADGVQTLAAEGCQIFVEIGPKSTLLGLVGQNFDKETRRQGYKETDSLPLSPSLLPSLREGQSDWQQMLASLGELYVRGVALDWSGLGKDEPRRKVVLPTYPFQRQRYWLDPHSHSISSLTLGEGRGGGLRPLIAQMTRSPAIREILFESTFSLQRMPFLADHRVYDNFVSPGACQLSMALSAAELTLNRKGGLRLEDMVLPQPLVLGEQNADLRTVQVVLTPTVANGSGSAYELQLLSFAPGAEPSESAVHLVGKVVTADQSDPPPIDLNALRQGWDRPLDPGLLYSRLAAVEIALGPSFRWVRALWSREIAPLPGHPSDNGRAVRLEFLAELQRPEAIPTTAGYLLHPGLLDGCFQVAAAALEGVASAPFLPFAVQELHFHRPAAGDRWWCHARQREDTRWDIQLLDEAGAPVAVITGFELREAKTGLLQPKARWRKWLHRVVWQPQPVSAAAPRCDGQHWLILADRQGVGSALADRLRAAGATCQMLHADDPQAADFTQLLARSAPDGPLHGIVHLWSLDEAESACASALHLIQALLRTDIHPIAFLFVTQEAQAIQPGDRVSGVAGAPLWGLGRVAALEHPELNPVLVDVEVEGDPVEQLLAEATARLDTMTVREGQIGWRRGVRYAARLLPAAQSAAQDGFPLPAAPYQLIAPERGSLDALRLTTATRRDPAAGEIEVAVRAAGLNFRDVLMTLGLYPGGDGRIGMECAGVVARVGAAVQGFAPGDRVLGLATSAFGSFVTAKALLFVKIPDSLSDAQAAAIPVAFLTAFYGLDHLARLQPGERVLIHAASGGVGQAAVQIARQRGAEVYATASRGKWQTLAEMGVSHIYDSRSTDFAGQILADTEGRGVDVVLNSLTGEGFIEASLAALAPGGRFLEIAKRDIWTPEAMAAARPDVAYHLYDLGELIARRPELVAQLFSEALALFARGELAPLPCTCFPIRQALAAFRLMQQARHTGKLVLTLPSDGPLPVRPDASYLISGGLGGVGLETAKWLARQGAGQLLLLGRRAPSPEVESQLAELRASGTVVTAVQADVSDWEQVERALTGVDPAFPLAGIIHAAGVLDDGALLQQSWPRFLRVFAPKVQGALNLHRLSQGQALDFFVCFSSVASLLGTAGQANYAAANAFLDAFAHARRAQGEPFLAVNWGAWAEVGMAAEQVARSGAEMARRGEGAIAPAEGVEIFAHLLGGEAVQMGVLPFAWERYLQQSGREQSFYNGLRTAPPAAAVQQAAPARLRQQLAESEASQRPGLLMAQLQQSAAKILGTGDGAHFDPGVGLMQMGLDSLMAVELRNQLSRALELSLPATLIFDYPTLRKLRDYLLERLDVPVNGVPARSSAPADGQKREAAVAISEDIDLLSDDDLMAQINAAFARR